MEPNLRQFTLLADMLSYASEVSHIQKESLMEQRIRYDGRRKWFWQTPNLVDDAGFSPYEFRLLCHYYRVGTCWEATGTTAKKCCMSTGMVSKTRKSLAEKGWIEISWGISKTMNINVVDKWGENHLYYSIGKSSKRSPHEQERSPYETKNTYIRRT